ncbi:nuclear transport factor 2 family protein [Mucilaginibacter sp. UYCu711]|jgi:hypothetical protein|uniref:nuclear transport factor 2 family protein n=1 Tax=Mucilaginibacter sp. UYCu711 TaxID=3156339 RepID=UPI003D25A44C
MKSKLLVICIIVALAITTNSSYAKVPPVVSNYEAVIGDYITSYMNSDSKKLKKILSDDACVKIPRAEAVIVQHKANLVEQMRVDAVKQNCTSKYEIIVKSDALVIARVDFEYASFKQQNYITLEKNEDKEWKITQICKFFPANDKNPVSDAADATARVK